MYHLIFIDKIKNIMKICLIGKNLTNLVLAKNLANKNLSVDIIFNKNTKKSFSQRTLAISKENFNFLLKINSQLKKIAWPVRNIKIYNDKNNSKELLEFKNKKKENFFLVKYTDIFNIFEKICKKSINIKLKKLDYQHQKNNFYLERNYKLIINSDKSRNLNYKKIEKNYDSLAYTATLIHEKKLNNEAIQIFTKYGPLAFLPLSKSKTSVVFSIMNKFKISETKILDLIKQYNFKYKIKNISKIEKSNLNFFMPRSYSSNNMLLFGDMLHKIHPLAGQGFNMTIRDIKILSSLIDEKIDLGLELDKSLFFEFQKKTKHLNYIFGMSIDFIHEFFKFDNKTNNLLSNSIFSTLGKNILFKKYISLIADKGINI